MSRKRRRYEKLPLVIEADVINMDTKGGGLPPPFVYLYVNSCRVVRCKIYSTRLPRPFFLYCSAVIPYVFLNILVKFVEY